MVWRTWPLDRSGYSRSSARRISLAKKWIAVSGRGWDSPRTPSDGFSPFSPDPSFSISRFCFGVSSFSSLRLSGLKVNLDSARSLAYADASAPKVLPSGARPMAITWSAACLRSLLNELDLFRANASRFWPDTASLFYPASVSSPLWGLCIGDTGTSSRSPCLPFLMLMAFLAPADAAFSAACCSFCCPMRATSS